MKSKKGPISLIMIGFLFALGPLWGLIDTAIKMIRTFNIMAGSGSNTPNCFSSDISISLLATWTGLIMLPIGIALLIGGNVWLFKIKKSEKSIEPAGSDYRAPRSV